MIYRQKASVTWKRIQIEASLVQEDLFTCKTGRKTGLSDNENGTTILTGHVESGENGETTKIGIVIAIETGNEGKGVEAGTEIATERIGRRNVVKSQSSMCVLPTADVQLSHSFTVKAEAQRR